MEEKMASGKFPGGNVVKRKEVTVAKGKTGPDGRPLTRETEVFDRIEFQPAERPEHMQNFLDCIRTREQPTLNADIAYRVMVAIALSVRSYRENKVMRFDPVKEKIV
jgi:hypothetical protein